MVKAIGVLIQNTQTFSSGNSVPDLSASSFVYCRLSESHLFFFFLVWLTSSIERGILWFLWFWVLFSWHISNLAICIWFCNLPHKFTNVFLSWSLKLISGWTDPDMVFFFYCFVMFNQSSDSNMLYSLHPALHWVPIGKFPAPEPSFWYHFDSVGLGVFKHPSITLTTSIFFFFAIIINNSNFTF